MEYISVFIICLLSISIVRGEEDLTCKVGYGMIPTDIRTSGLASQCSGVSKITTPAECKAAAEYNRKNNIDYNYGCGGGRCLRNLDSSDPYGCLLDNYQERYYFYPNKKKINRKLYN